MGSSIDNTFINTSCTAGGLSWGERTHHRALAYCTNVQYEGTVCKYMMESWKGCIGERGGEKELHVYMNKTSINSKENDIKYLNTFLGKT